MRVLPYLLIWCFLSACTSGAIDNGNVDDPFENFNRKSYRFSESVDGNFLAPVAGGYARVTPDPLEKGISNVFKNFNNAPSAINGFLQGDVETGFNELSRLIVNSTLGLGGLIDLATIWGINEKKEDIGQTLAVWGIKESPFIYLPIFGPTTLRDLPVRFVGMSMPRLIIGEDFPGYVTALQVISQRADLIEVIEQRDSNAIDAYAFTRDAYIQRRAFEIYNGDPPIEDFFDEFEEE